MSALRSLLLAWGGLLLLLLAQLGSTLVLQLPATASVFGVVEAVIVVVAFMRIRSGSPMMHIFGAAGLFWLVLLLALGSLDPATRTDFLILPAMNVR
jgi:cytochrome c oxidase subunit IV